MIQGGLILALVCCRITNAIENENLDYLAGRISVQDEMLIEDKELALAHIEMDIKDLETFQKTIQQLRKEIRQHSDQHLVDQPQLIIADALLQDVSSHDILPSLASLKDLKREIVAVKHKFSDVTIMEINAIVEAAEQFLSDSMSLVHDIEKKNEDWNAEEERKKLQQTFNSETNFSEPLVEKIYQNKSRDVNYPVKKSEGIKLSMEIARDAIKKVKEEKEGRKVSTEKSDFDAQAAEVDEEKFIEQLNKKLDAEEKRRQEKFAKNTHNIIMNETREAFEAVKEESRQFIAKVQETDESVDIKVNYLMEHFLKIKNLVKALIRDRYYMLMLMGVFVLVILIVLISLRPARRVMRMRRERQEPELPRSIEDGEAGATGGWKSWSPWSAQRRYQQKLK